MPVFTKIIVLTATWMEDGEAGASWEGVLPLKGQDRRITSLELSRDLEWQKRLGYLINSRAAWWAKTRTDCFGTRRRSHCHTGRRSTADPSTIPAMAAEFVVRCVWRRLDQPSFPNNSLNFQCVSTKFETGAARCLSWASSSAKQPSANNKKTIIPAVKQNDVHRNGAKKSLDIKKDQDGDELIQKRKIAKS